MHEMSLCENLLGILEEQAAVQDFCRVKRVRLEIGPFSCVEPEALRFGYDVVMRGTMVEGSELEIVAAQGTGYCLKCLQTVPIKTRFDNCPLCGGAEVQVVGGDELRIQELEVV